MADFEVFRSKQFTTGIQMLAQEKGAKLPAHVRVEPIFGAERASFDQYGEVELVEQTVRDSPTVIGSPNTARRWVVPKPFSLGILIDPMDVRRVTNDPTHAANKALAMAYGRRQDRAIIAAALGTAKTGNDGATSTTHPAGDYTIAHGSAGLTQDKVVNARRVMHTAKEEGPFHFVYNAYALASILKDTTLTSNDYLAGRALQNGEMPQWMGYAWHHSELLEDTGTSTERQCLAYVEDALLLGVLQQGRGRIDNRPDLNNIPQVWFGSDIGATRMTETGVVEVIIDETA